MSRTIQVKLGTLRAAPTGDALGRRTIGWLSGMSSAEAWEAGRGAWRLDPTRVLDFDEVQVINPDGTVVAIATLTGVSKAGGDGRFAFEGDLREDDPRIGQPSAFPHRSRNPIQYIEED